MNVHQAKIHKIGLKWKVKKIHARKGDIIIWHLKKRFRIWMPPGNPFGPYEILTGVTTSFGGFVTGRKGVYTYQMYIVDERNPHYRWVEGDTPPTIIIR